MIINLATTNLSQYEKQISQDKTCIQTQMYTLKQILSQLYDKNFETIIKFLEKTDIYSINVGVYFVNWFEALKILILYQMYDISILEAKTIIPLTEKYKQLFEDMINDLKFNHPNDYEKIFDEYITRLKHILSSKISQQEQTNKLEIETKKLYDLTMDTNNNFNINVIKTNDNIPKEQKVLIIEQLTQLLEQRKNDEETIKSQFAKIKKLICENKDLNSKKKIPFIEYFK